VITRENVDRWLEAYVRAWKSYDRDEIAALFSEDVSYRYHPYDEPIEGRGAVVESWLGEGGHDDASTRDPEGTYDASYRAVAVDGEAAVAVGTSSYSEAPGGPVTRVFDNCFVIRFDDQGLCREFTEWFVERPDP
jgi:ketosteroid isomerase-like protein